MGDGQRIIDGLRDAILHARGYSDRAVALHAYAAERARMANMTTAQVKRLWDRYDGCNSPLGISGEAIHLELNLRGHGHYCAV